MVKDIFELMSEEDGVAQFERITQERLPKVLALRKKFGHYIVQDHPEAMDMFDLLMKDDIPEPFASIEKEFKKFKEKYSIKNCSISSDLEFIDEDITNKK